MVDIADWLHNLAGIALREQDLREAETLLEESIALWRRIGGDTSGPLADLGKVILQKGGSPHRAATATMAHWTSSYPVGA